MDNLEELLIKVAERSKSNSHRLDEAEKKLADYGEVVSSIKVLAQKQENMDGDIKEIKADVKSLTEKPAKRWDGVVDKVIGVIIGAVVGYILMKVGLA